MAKSNYSETIEESGIPKSTLRLTLNVIFPPLEFNYLKHLWNLISTGYVKKEIFRKLVMVTTTKNRIGGATCLIRDKEV